MLTEKRKIWKTFAQPNEQALSHSTFLNLKLVKEETCGFHTR
jgi:hypothetical protein